MTDPPDRTESKTVMAAQTTHDEVNHPGSASDRSLPDGDASNSNNQQLPNTKNAEAQDGALPNGIETADHATAQETTSGAAADTDENINKGHLTVNEGKTVNAIFTLRGDHHHNSDTPD